MSLCDTFQRSLARFDSDSHRGAEPQRSNFRSKSLIRNLQHRVASRGQKSTRIAPTPASKTLCALVSLCDTFQRSLARFDSDSHRGAEPQRSNFRSKSLIRNLQHRVASRGQKSTRIAPTPASKTLCALVSLCDTFQRSLARFDSDSHRGAEPQRSNVRSKSLIRNLHHRVASRCQKSRRIAPTPASKTLCALVSLCDTFQRSLARFDSDSHRGAEPQRRKAMKWHPELCAPDCTLWIATEQLTAAIPRN